MVLSPMKANWCCRFFGIRVSAQRPREAAWLKTPKMQVTCSKAQPPRLPRSSVCLPEVFHQEGLSRRESKTALQ